MKFNTDVQKQKQTSLKTPETIYKSNGVPSEKTGIFRMHFHYRNGALHRIGNNLQKGKLIQPSDNIHFLWPHKYIQNRMRRLFSVHRTLTMLSITPGYNSSTLWSMIFGTLVSRECRIVCNLAPGSQHIMAC
jgi:hypothetical protein